MGLFNRKKANAPNRAPTKEKVAADMRAEAKVQASKLIKIAKECASLVNKTTDPAVFFSKYKLMLDSLRKLEGLEGLVNFTGETPREAYARAEAQFKQETNTFLYRAFKEAKENGKSMPHFFDQMEGYFCEMPPESATYLSALRDAITAKAEQEREYWRLWAEANADAEYQSDLNTFYALLTHIREMYSVIGSVGSFSDEAGDRLIDSCAEAIEIEEKIRENREYYENTHFEMSEPRKTLAMIYEKRGDYEHAANVCAFAIRSGYPKDGTDGGMRGRMARMIKKGNLPLTDAYKEVLGL